MKTARHLFDIYRFPLIGAISAYTLLVVVIFTIKSYPIATALNLIGGIFIGRIYVLWKRN